MLFEKLGQATSDVKISRKNRIQTFIFFFGKEIQQTVAVRQTDLWING